MLSHGVVKNAKSMNAYRRVGAHSCCTCFPVARRCPRSSKEAVSSSGSTLRLFESHPYRSPPAAEFLVAYAPPSHPRDPIVKTLVCLDCCLQCILSWALGSAIDCGIAEWCRCHTSREGLNHTASVEHVEHVAPLPAWKPQPSVPELECYTTDPVRTTPLRVSPRKARWRVPSPGPLPGI